MELAIQSPTKLPVLATLLRSWGSVLRNVVLALRLYWPWIAIFLICILSVEVGARINSYGAEPSATLRNGASWVPALVAVIAFILSMPAIAVGWTRGVVRGERPSAPIRLDSAVWAYFGAIILMTIAIVLVYLVMGLLIASVGAISLGVGTDPMSLERLAALGPLAQLINIPVFLLLSRFSLVLPAIALGERMSFADSFRRTRGNTLRLTFLGGLVYLPLAVATGVLQIVSVAFPTATWAVLSASILVLLSVLFYAHAYLSLGGFALQHLKMGEDVRAA
jgi:hypothetical protein